MTNNETSEKIIIAMFELISEKGYEKASMEQIAKKIDMKKASIYYHFKNKEAIALALISKYCEAQIADFSFYETKNLEEIKAYLLNFGFKIIDESVNDQSFHKVFSEIRLLGERNDTIKAQLNNYESKTREVIEKLFSHGINIKVLDSSFDSKTSANLVYLMLEGSDSALIYKKDIDVKASYELLLTLICNQGKAVYEKDN